MLSTIHSHAPVAAIPYRFAPHQCQHGEHHSDCYSPGHSQPGIYSRPRFMAEATPQMGDWAPGSYESNCFTIGDEPSQQQQQWTANLGEVPKDCYYCKGSGDCPQDGPEKGKDYMGQKCNSCSGSGKCYRCGGDGVIG